MQTLGKITLYADCPITYTKKQLLQLQNYGKLIWYDSKEYTEHCKSHWLTPCKSLLTEAIDADAESFASHKENEVDTSDGDIESMTPKSMQYEEAINDLLLWYTSNHDKKIKASKQLKNLAKPIHKVYLVEQINKTLIRKSNKSKKRFSDNPFVWEFVKRWVRSPLQNLNDKILENHYTIQKYEMELDELKAKYTRHWNVKDREQAKRIEKLLLKFI